MVVTHSQIEIDPLSGSAFPQFRKFNTKIESTSTEAKKAKSGSSDCQFEVLEECGSIDGTRIELIEQGIFLRTASYLGQSE